MTDIYKMDELTYVQSIINNATDVLMRIPGVVGVGITHSYITGIGNEHQILVYIKDESVIQLLPNSIYGMRIVWTVSGEITVSAFIETSEEYERWLGEELRKQGLGSLDTIQSMQKGKYRPLVGGVSGGIFATIKSTGTIGCIAKEAGGSGRTVLVSNNHVFVLDVGTIPWKGVKGDPIIQPGAKDGGTINDKVATLEKWIRIEASGNTVDCAYALPIVDTTTPNFCNLYANSSINPVIGMAVNKAGRTTGCTNGQIESINVTSNVKYTVNSASQGEISFVAQFSDCIGITGYNASQSGDSGSIWVSTTGNNVVGLNFAAGSSGAIACKAKNVESRLGVVFGDVGGGGGTGCNPTVSLTISGGGGGGGGTSYDCIANTCTLRNDTNGQYPDLTSCISSGCGGGGVEDRYSCKELLGVKYCDIDPQGPYSSLTDCNAACQTVIAQKFACKDLSGIKYCDIDPNGEYTSFFDCMKMC